MRAVGFSLVGYDGGGVGDPLFPEFVLFLLCPWSSWVMLFSVDVSWFICSCRGSVLPQ